MILTNFKIIITIISELKEQIIDDELSIIIQYYITYDIKIFIISNND